jgi:ribosomal protein S1
MTLKLNAFESYIKSNESVFRILSLKRYKFKGKIISKKLVAPKIDFGYYKEFQATKIELETFFKYNRKLYMKNEFKLINKKLNFVFKGFRFNQNPFLNNNIVKKEASNFFKKYEVIKSLRKSLYHKKVITGRFTKSIRGGHTITFAGFFTFVPRSHLFNYKKKIKTHIERFDVLSLTVISIKCYKNRYRRIHKLNIVLSPKQAFVKIVNHNKKLNSKRIYSLNKLVSIC